MSIQKGKNFGYYILHKDRKETGNTAPGCMDPKAMHGPKSRRSFMERERSGTSRRGDTQWRGESEMPNLPGWQDVLTIFISAPRVVKCDKAEIDEAESMD
jgi:hypothetical protein